jgi:hypothetical protein
MMTCLGLAPRPAAAAGGGLLGAVLQQAANTSESAVRTAVASTACAIETGYAAPSRLAVIDFTRPSTQRRLWVFDVKSGRVLFDEVVAHGRSSGDNYATRFSNQLDSHESSLGLFRTLNAYQGSNGYSLRLEGLEPGTNDKAFERAIVIHGAAYVDPVAALRQGRLGRSFGCPAVRREVSKPLIDALKGGQMLYAYYPQQDYLQRTRLLGCEDAQALLGPRRPSQLASR